MTRGVTNQDQMTSVSNYAQNVGGMYSMMNNERHQMKADIAKPQALSAPKQSNQHFQRRTDEASSEMFANSKTTSNAYNKKK
jgi:hypothetical protein